MKVEFTIVDFLLVSPAIGLFAMSIMPLIIKVLKGNKEQNRFATLTYGVIGIVVSTGLILSTSGLHQRAFQGALMFDGTTTLMSLMVMFSGLIALILSKDNKATASNQYAEFVFLLLNSMAGMLTVIWSNDLIVTFIGIEVMSLCLYILIAMSVEPKLSKEAAFKYFVLGSFASAIFLYGIAYIYGSAGGTYIDEVSVQASQLSLASPLFLFGVIMVVVGLLFKVSIFPFHAWTPDVYQGSPTPVTTFMATGVKIVCFAFLLRMVSAGFMESANSNSLMTVLEWLAVFTMIVGNVAAILQKSFKRMLAYSSISHSGYALIGIIAAGSSGQFFDLGATGLIFYIFSYTIMTAGAFGAICLFEKKAETDLAVEDLKGLASKRPLVAICISIFMLSLTGIPPTIGFFGKFFIFSAAIKQGLFWLVFWGVLSSVVSVYYYLRPIVLMYMSDEQGADIDTKLQLNKLVVVSSAIMVLLFGICSNPFYEYITNSVESMF